VDAPTLRTPSPPLQNPVRRIPLNVLTNEDAPIISRVRDGEKA